MVNKDVLLAIHDRQIAEHGGGEGIRDTDLFESALQRPSNRAAYDEACDAASLAASYAFGIARNHAFIDGNKRTAWIAARLFLVDNGIAFSFTAIEAIQTMERVAAGIVDEQSLAEWFRIRIGTKPQPTNR